MRSALLLLLVCVVSLPAWGQRIDLVTGFEGADRIGYLYGTASMAVPVSENVDLVPRLTLSYLFYSYESGQGEVSVRSPGAIAGAGVRFRVPNISLTVGPGIEARSTTRSTPLGRTTTRHAGLHLMGNLWSRPSPSLTFTTGGSYSFVNEYGSVGATLLHRLSPTGVDVASLSAGVEALLMGNPEAYAYGGGGILGTSLGDGRTMAQLRFGYLYYVAGETREGRPYYGVGIVRMF